MTPAEWLTVGFGAFSSGMITTVFYRLGRIGARVEDHARRIDDLEARFRNWMTGRAA